MQLTWYFLGRKIFNLFFNKNLLIKNKNTLYERAIRDYSYFNNYVDFNGKFILDVGCGEGIKTNYYSQICRSIIGIDISINAIEKHHKKHNSHYLLADGGNLPFRLKIFDIIVSNDVFEHVKNPEIVLKSISYIIKSEGYICINFGPLWLSPFGSHLGFNENWFMPWGHIIFNESKIKKLLKSKKNIEINEDSHLFSHLNKMTIKQFEEMIKSLGMKVIFIKLITISPLKILINTSIREYITTQIITLLFNEH